MAVSGGLDHFVADPYTMARSDLIISFQPRDWELKAFYSEGKGREVKRISGFNDHGYRYSIPSQIQAQALLERSHQLSDKKKQSLVPLLTLPQGQQTGFLYGLHDGFGNILNNYVNGLQSVISERRDLFPRGTVLSVVNDSVDVYEKLYHLEALTSRYKNIKVSYDESFSELQKKIMNLSRGEILIVPVEQLPQPLFQRLLGTSTLPPTIKGKNAVDFMTYLAKPFFLVSGSDLENESLYPKMNKVSDQVFEASIKLSRSLSKIVDYSVVSKLLMIGPLSPNQMELEKSLKVTILEALTNKDVIVESFKNYRDLSLPKENRVLAILKNLMSKIRFLQTSSLKLQCRQLF